MDQPTFLIYDPSADLAFSLLNPLFSVSFDRPVLNPALGVSLPSYNYGGGRSFKRAVFSDLVLFNSWIAQIWSLPPETGRPNPVIVMGRNDISRGVRMARADIYNRALASFTATPPRAVAATLSPSLLIPRLSIPLPSALIPRTITARTTVGHPIILIYDPGNTAYPDYRYDAGLNSPIDSELIGNCDFGPNATFQPCPGIRRGVFTDLALFNAWIAKIWGLSPESGSVAPIVVLGRRDVTRGGRISKRDMEIRADANYAVDPDTNTRTPPAPGGVPTPGGGVIPGGTPAVPTTNRTPDYGGTIQIFGPADCGACSSAMNYLRSISVPAEKVNITSASDPRLTSALARAGASARGGATPIIIHTKGTPRVTQGFSESDLRARYFVSAPIPTPGTPLPTPGATPTVPAPDTTTPETPLPAAPVFNTTFVGPLTYKFVAEGTAPRSWSFGDGLISMDSTPTHTYTTPGTYTIGLRMPSDSTNVTTSTLEVLAAGTPGTITPSVLPTLATSTSTSQSTSPIPFIVGAGLVYGAYTLWRKLRG